MKKIIYLFLLLSAFEVKAQDAVVFKMKYTPGHKYGSVLAMAINVKVNMTGDDQMIEKLKSQGITMPLSANINLKVNGDINTGTKAADNSFPVTINYSIQDLMLEFSGNQIDPLKGKSIGIKIYAHNGPDGKIKADSTYVNNKKDTSHTFQMSDMLDKLQNQVKFPDHALKVGDTFTQEAPMNLPAGKGMSGINLSKTTVKSTYTLTSITDGKAYFDLTQIMDIALSVKTANVTLTGNGTGKLVYSIKDNFPLSFNDKMTLKLNVTAGKMVIDGTADITLDSTHTVN